MGKFKNLGGALKRALPTILSVLAGVGVVGTAVLTAKAVHEVELHGQDPKKQWKKFIPAASVGAGTIACIFGANILNRKQQASIASAAMLFTEPYRRYQQKVKEKFGEEAHEEIMEEIHVEETNGKYIYTVGPFGDDSCINIDGIAEQHQQFYDVFSKRFFMAKPTQVLQAMYHANRNFHLGGCEMLQEFYMFLGLERMDEFDDLMWCVNDDMYWIDFNIERRKELVNGMPCFDISVYWDPMKAENWEYEYPHMSYTPTSSS